MTEQLIDRLCKFGQRIGKFDDIDEGFRTACVQECAELMRLAATSGAGSAGDGAVPADFVPPRPPPSSPLGGQSAPSPEEIQASLARFGRTMAAAGLEVVIRPIGR